MKGTGKLGGNCGNIDKANALADTHAAKVIDVIRPMKETGQTLQQIADALNKLGLPTSRNGRWCPTTVKNALVRVLI